PTARYGTGALEGRTDRVPDKVDQKLVEWSAIGLDRDVRPRAHREGSARLESHYASHPLGDDNRLEAWTGQSCQPRVRGHQTTERLRPTPDHPQPLLEIVSPVQRRRVPAHQLREALRDRFDRGERVVELMAQHADQPLPRLPLLVTQRAAHVGENEELMRQPALAKRPAPHLPTPLPRTSRKRDLEHARRVARQRVGEPELCRVLAEQLLGRSSEQRRTTAIDEAQRARLVERKHGNIDLL